LDIATRDAELLTIDYRAHAGVPAHPRYLLYSDPPNRRSTTVAGTIDTVSDANFQAEVIESEVPVLVDFWAPWCGPCRAVAPVLEQINGEKDDLRIVKLNIDDNQATAAKYGVMSIPTMIVFKNGQVAKQIVGALPKARLEQELEPALAS